MAVVTDDLFEHVIHSWTGLLKNFVWRADFFRGYCFTSFHVSHFGDFYFQRNWTKDASVVCNWTEHQDKWTLIRLPVAPQKMWLYCSTMDSWKTLHWPCKSLRVSVQNLPNNTNCLAKLVWKCYFLFSVKSRFFSSSYVSHLEDEEGVWSKLCGKDKAWTSISVGSVKVLKVVKGSSFLL